MTPGTRDDSDGGPPRDEVIRALSDGRRRSLLRVLHGSGGLDTAELARRVTRGNATARDDACTDADVVAVDIYHRHLPVLADAGLVAVDREGVAAVTDRGATVAASLDEFKAAVS